MKKFYLPTMAAAVLLGFAACSSDDLASIDPTTPSTSNDENVPINFGSYVGKAQNTRAAGSNINTIDSLIEAGGFGVFAINTETNKFAPDNATDHYLYNDYNYMFNQQVKGANANGTTTWETTPAKYWPNKTLTYTTTGVGKDAVTTVTEKPQYVTFFAYAPYCKIFDPYKESETVSDRSKLWEASAFSGNGTDGFKGGIFAMSTSQYFEDDIAETDQKKWFSKADPIIAIDLTNASNQIDLLWGTTGDNGVTEGGDPQKGEKFKNNIGTETEGTEGGKYYVNADLTKMKTDGKVSFAFKHALASFGGHKAGEEADKNTITIDAVADAVKPSDTKQLASDTRISLKWLAIEVMGTTDGSNTVAYPTKGFFNLATGLWGEMAKDPTNENEETNVVSYKKENNPVYVLYPNGAKNFNYGDVSPYFDNKVNTTYKKIPLNSALTVNGDGGDTYNDFITASGETSDVDDKGNPIVIPASSKWNTTGTQEESGSEEEGSGSEEEGTTKKVPNAGVTTTATSVYGSDKDYAPLLIIPNSTIRPKLKVIASYDIVTPDPAYADIDGHKGYTKANQIVGQDVTFTNVAELNKKYNLHIHLGVTSMKVDATVDDWDDASEPGTGESVVEETKDIDLPANVEPEEGGTTPNP